tara:strand:+ start:2118 stop:2810 length:693 start_codon:yes stop_codon:yes gene_type:complete
MTVCNEFTAIIPVKANSSRLPGKNFLKIGQLSLLERKIKQLLPVFGAENILISTDSEIAQEAALKYGLQLDIRPGYFCDESKPFSEFLNYLKPIIQTNYFCWAPCTSPFVSSTIFKDAIETFLLKLNENKCDSLITVSKFENFLMDKEGPVNFKTGIEHVNSEDLPPYYIFTCGIIIAAVENIPMWNYHFGPNPHYFEVDEITALDIDTAMDLFYARAIENSKINDIQLI